MMMNILNFVTHINSGINKYELKLKREFSAVAIFYFKDQYVSPNHLYSINWIFFHTNQIL